MTCEYLRIKKLVVVLTDSGTWKKTWKCCLLGKLDRTNLIYRLVLDFQKHLSSLRPQVPLTWKSVRCFLRIQSTVSYFVTCKFFCSKGKQKLQLLTPAPNYIQTFSWIFLHRLIGGCAFHSPMGDQGKLCSSRFKNLKRKTWYLDCKSFSTGMEIWRKIYIVFL